ncbi:MAG: type VI secretion system protein ImpK [Bacteriovoracaceae bacterium]|jgi:type VI secretion system protein ImpK|uniref:T6SS outer membrane component TssL (ImpK/VasF) n=1 Tax=Marinomonas primoryensis TaxID=178399 RepID=A0A859CUA4_9GAMM|nr:type IVB secretion system protein IcmH/DotU [Marinomonas primoryensis]QKK79837.1 T6SS outer membrane component TssL (ImpK/VasF) [Marinomonas primoryensis]|tara:strand:+ start:12959 stop:13735 length:777 start_codon:yes stop_codon:yes gene_type:complete
MAGNGNAGNYDDLLFDEAKNINEDKEYWFQLRGHNTNPLIDTATSFFGLSLRVKSLSKCPNIEQIYKQTIEEINIIEIELTEKGYEHAVLMAYRYILCAFLDEAVMGTKWGGSSVWAEYSMLSRYHNETWGGEKVFTIVSRLEKDPERYKDLLEFMYRCLVLGFEGKFKVMKNGREEREKIINKIYTILNSMGESQPQKLTSSTNQVVNTRYKLSRQLPVWSVFALFSIVWMVAFSGYYFLLHSKSKDVLIQLNQILQ